MSRVVVKLVSADDEPVKGVRVTLWWKGFGVPESSSEEYTDSDGEAIFDYSTGNWSGDEVAVYVEGTEYSPYSSPEDYYEFTYD